MPYIEKSNSKTLRRRRKPYAKKSRVSKPKESRMSKNKKGGMMNSLARLKLNNYLKSRGYTQRQILTMTHTTSRHAGHAPPPDTADGSAIVGWHPVTILIY